MNVRRTLLAGVSAVGLAIVGVPAHAQLSDPQQGGPQLTPAEELDEAFHTLSAMESERAARRAERLILRRWLDTESDTVDLLMSWTLDAMDSEDYALALDYLDRVVIMQPEYAEGWNKRATVHYLRDDYSRAIADLEQVLAREPRHFGAMSGLGFILRDIGETDRAIEAFKAALAIDPLLDSVREALDELEAAREAEL